MGEKIAESFGTTDLDTAKEYYLAGEAVTRASGKPPSEVLQRISEKAGVTSPKILHKMMFVKS